MKGAMAVPSVRTINALNKNKNNIIGVNHHFLRLFKKS